MSKNSTMAVPRSQSSLLAAAVIRYLHCCPSLDSNARPGNRHPSPKVNRRTSSISRISIHQQHHDKEDWVADQAANAKCSERRLAAVATQCLTVSPSGNNKTKRNIGSLRKEGIRVGLRINQYFRLTVFSHLRPPRSRGRKL